MYSGISHLDQLARKKDIRYSRYGFLRENGCNIQADMTCGDDFFLHISIFLSVSKQAAGKAELYPTAEFSFPDYPAAPPLFQKAAAQDL